MSFHPVFKHWLECGECATVHDITPDVDAAFERGRAAGRDEHGDVCERCAAQLDIGLVVVPREKLKAARERLRLALSSIPRGNYGLAITATEQTHDALDALLADEVTR